MSDIQMMNSQMLEIMKNYLEICTFFNEKLEEIKADELLNVNLDLLKASIIDLNINISNFKSDLQYNEEKTNTQFKQQNQSGHSNQSGHTNQSDQSNLSLENFKGLYTKNILSLFFMYLMQIDKDSILNKFTSTTNNSIYNTNNLESATNTVNTNNHINSNNKIYNNPESDLD